MEYDCEFDLGKPGFVVGLGYMLDEKALSKRWINDVTAKVNKEGIDVWPITLRYDDSMDYYDFCITVFDKVIYAASFDEDAFNAVDDVGDLIAPLVYEAIVKNRNLFDREKFRRMLKIDRRMKTRNFNNYKILWLYFKYVERNSKQQFHWMKKMAALKSPWALNKLGNMYRNGDGCDVNEKLAWKMMRNQRRGIYKEYQF